MCENNKDIVLEKIYKETYKLFVSVCIPNVWKILEAYANRGEIQMLEACDLAWGYMQFTFSADDEIAEELKMVLQQYC